MTPLHFLRKGGESTQLKRIPAANRQTRRDVQSCAFDF